MAVFTSVPETEAAGWLEGFAIGTLVELKGIASGIENTNYFLTTTRGRYVLTIFEKLTDRELPFYLHLMAHLAHHGIPCPAPVAGNDGRLHRTLKGKPAAIVSRLAGASVMAPGPAHCAEVGRTLADMHRAGASFEGRLAHPRGASWRAGIAPLVRPFLDAARQRLLDAELAFQARIDLTTLPQGPIHADLFRDNVLFDGARIGGVIDFYFAGIDALLFDVAVTLNDWCIDPGTGRIDDQRASAFLAAYTGRRPVNEAERAAWPAMLRAGALRFWLSRLYDFYLPRAGELIHAHDPEHFRRILELRAGEPASLPSL